MSKITDDLRNKAARSNGLFGTGVFKDQVRRYHTENLERAEVDAGIAGSEVKARVTKDRALLNDPAVQYPLADLPIIGAAGAGVSAASKVAPGLASRAFQAVKEKATGFVEGKLPGLRAAQGKPTEFVGPQIPRIAGQSAANSVPTKISTGAQAAVNNVTSNSPLSTPSAAEAAVPGVAVPEAAASAQELRQVSTLPPDTGGTIIGTSTRADGKLNSFVGGSNQVNPEDFAAATERAAADRSKLIGLAAAKVSEGDLDGAYRLAAGDPEAAAAVESARQQRGLRIRSVNGDRQASDLLRQQGVNEASLAGKRIDAEAATGASAIKAQSDLQLGLAKAKQDAAARTQAQANFERTTGNAEGQQNQKDIQFALEGALGPRVLKDGPNPDYAKFESKLNETLLQEAKEEQAAAAKEGRAPRPTRTLSELHPTELQDFLRQYDLDKKSAPGVIGRAVNYVTGNSRSESNDLRKGAAKEGLSKEGFFYDTYTNQQDQVRRLTDEYTLEERKRAGLTAGNR